MRQRTVLILSVLILTAFTAWQIFATSAKATRTHLLLAHGLPPDHPVHLGMVKFKEDVFKRSHGSLDITIYPSAQLGNEKQILELVQMGAISMTKVSSLSLESFSPLIGVLNLPFIFRDQQHYFSVLDSSIGDELLLSTAAKKFHGLTYYDAGSRSFYANRVINAPADVVGLKIRVMESATAIRMMQLLGGSPTPMPYGEVYTALQQGVIDGAENNITAITVNRHGEVIKNYSKVEHISAPEFLLISEPVWQSLTPENQAILKEEAEKSKLYQRAVWAERVAEYEKEAQLKLGVKFNTPDRQPFMRKVLPLHDEYAQRGSDFARLIQAIKSH